MNAVASLTAYAYVSLTVTASVTFTDARCPSCHRLIMAVPGMPTLEVRAVANNTQRSGRGPVVSCQRCRTLCEVITHRTDAR